MNNELINLWLESKNVSDWEKLQIKQMDSTELEIAFANIPLAFGTAGIRAKMGPGTQFLNKIVYYQMAIGYGRFLKYKFSNQPISVIVAHDNRNNGTMFSVDVVDVLTSLGIKVYLFEHNQLTSTPIVSYAIRALNANGAAIITASHNPKEDNGFKIYDETGGQVLPIDGAKVVEFMPDIKDVINLKVKNNDSLITFLDESIFTNYYNECKSALIKTKVDEIKNFPIVFSGQHGTACKRLPEFLQSLGYTNIIPVKQQCLIDGNFSHTLTPNPENRDAWNLSIKYADKYKSDVIIQVDPDADRFAMGVRYHNEWRFLSGNQMGIIYTYYVLKNKKFEKIPYVISSYVSTNLIDKILQSYGGKVYRVGTGFKWVGAKINEIGNDEEFVVGFEEAVGALNSTINRDKDAYQAAALALEIYYDCLQKQINIIDFLEQEIYHKYGIVYNDTVAFTFSELNWKLLVDERLQKILKFNYPMIGNRKIIDIKYNEIGGCYDWIFENNSWLRFRASGTEPKFKIYYNLYGDSLVELAKEAKVINAELKALLNL
ncbi:phospho-sugar mutase [Mycoplasmoides alvi]|uniref:phospho-sugar mutase n=1 Tax=Mycoplasmoides alvi TaxID=78580 RepID=UPI00051C5FAE|nr:phospho-sugar mutase [Mycoplasmoides alvi]